MVAVMIAGTFAIAALAPPSWGDAIAADGPGCPFHAATGVDCPFCGMTHATVAMGRGDWHAAFGFHPLAPVVVLGMLALLVIVAMGRADALVRGSRPLLLLAAIAVVWALRLLL